MHKLEQFLNEVEQKLSEIGPMKRRDLIDYLKDKGFLGPYAGGSHAYMATDKGKKVVVPNQHGGEVYSRGLVNRIFKQADLALAVA